MFTPLVKCSSYAVEDARLCSSVVVESCREEGGWGGGRRGAAEETGRVPLGELVSSSVHKK